MVAPSSDDIAHVCDRRIGVGADGFLRAIKAAHMPNWDGDPDLWFMDARDAFGGEAVVGGNGLRVFVRYLSDSGLLDGDTVTIATRLGTRAARVLPDGRIATETGAIEHGREDLRVRVGDDERPAAAMHVDIDFAVVECQQALAALDFGAVTVLAHDGTEVAIDDVCFWAESAPGRIALRHWERGIGQSVSCGTGAVAAAARYLRTRGQVGGRVVVDVVGGWLEVALDETGTGEIFGPARLTTRGEVFLP